MKIPSLSLSLNVVFFLSPDHCSPVVNRIENCHCDRGCIAIAPVAMILSGFERCSRRVLDRFGAWLLDSLRYQDKPSIRCWLSINSVPIMAWTRWRAWWRLTTPTKTPDWWWWFILITHLPVIVTMPLGIENREPLAATLHALMFVVVALGTCLHSSVPCLSFATSTHFLVELRSVSILESYNLRSLVLKYDYCDQSADNTRVPSDSSIEEGMPNVCKSCLDGSHQTSLY